MLYMDDTFDEEDGSMTWMDKTHLCKSCSHEEDFSENFVVNQLPTTRFRLCSMSLTTKHADYFQANKLVPVFVLILESKAL